MKKSTETINIVLGNHRSLWGLIHIIDVLQINLLKEFEITFSSFPKENNVNVFIEEFSNKKYLKNMREISSTNVLICTEFYKKLNTRNVLNRPDTLIHRIFSSLKLIYRAVGIVKIRVILRYTKSALADALRFSQKERYMKARAKGLEKALDYNLFSLIVMLHPNCIPVNDSIRTKIPCLTLMPQVKLTKKSQEFLISGITTNLDLRTYGSLSPYRDLMKQLISRNLSIDAIKHFNFDDLTSTKSKIKTEIADSTPIDMYFQNDTWWPYTSPIRIATSFSFGNVVCLVENNDNYHPITSVCLQIPHREGLQYLEQSLHKQKMNIKANLRLYNKEAKNTNYKIILALKELASKFGN